jgi:hypothetical protein
MASGQFVDPIQLLRITPLIAATLTLDHAFDSNLFLSALNQPSTRSKSNAALSTYFPIVSTAGFYRRLTSVSLTLAASIVNAVYSARSGKPSPARAWYTAGAVLAVAHFIFMPFMIASREAIRVNHPARDANVALDEWLWFNRLRGLTVDLSAFAVLGVAVAKSLCV